MTEEQADQIIDLLEEIKSEIDSFNNIKEKLRSIESTVHSIQEEVVANSRVTLEIKNNKIPELWDLIDRK